MQNVIARVGSEGSKVIICAHQDEIGLVVTNIDDDGAIRFYRNGGVDPRILPGLEVEIQTRDGALYGVVGAKAPHLLTREEAGKPVNYETLHIDVGLPADEVRQKVRVGDPIVMLAESQSLANGRMAGKTMDDRASVAAMLIAAAIGALTVNARCFVLWRNTRMPMSAPTPPKSHVQVSSVFSEIRHAPRRALRLSAP